MKKKERFIYEKIDGKSIIVGAEWDVGNGILQLRNLPITRDVSDFIVDFRTTFAMPPPVDFDFHAHGQLLKFRAETSVRECFGINTIPIGIVKLRIDEELSSKRSKEDSLKNLKKQLNLEG